MSKRLKIDPLNRLRVPIQMQNALKVSTEGNIDNWQENTLLSIVDFTHKGNY